MNTHLNLRIRPLIPIKLFFSLVVAVAANAFAVNSAKASSFYSAQLIEVPIGFSSLFAASLNDKSQVTGALLGSSYLPFVWQRGQMDELVEIPQLRGGFEPTHINLNGVIAGKIDVHSGDSLSRAATWNGVSLQLLESGARDNAAFAINDYGIVVGQTAGYEGTLAARWDSGSITKLGDLEGGRIASYATAVSNTGIVVGASSDESGLVAAYWAGTQPIAIGRLGFCQNEQNESGANDINSFGAIVGTSTRGCGGFRRAFIFNGNGLTELATFTERSVSEADAINDSGHIVGRIDDFAVLWESSQAPVLLETAVVNSDLYQDFKLHQGIDINSSGQILVRGSCTSAECRGTTYFLLTPVPEPSTLAYMVLGLLALSFIGSRALLNRRD